MLSVLWNWEVTQTSSGRDLNPCSRFRIKIYKTNITVIRINFLLDQICFGVPSMYVCITSKFQRIDDMGSADIQCFIRKLYVQRGVATVTKYCFRYDKYVAYLQRHLQLGGQVELASTAAGYISSSQSNDDLSPTTWPISWL